jgi:hypothetical protein
MSPPSPSPDHCFGLLRLTAFWVEAGGLWTRLRYSCRHFAPASVAAKSLPPALVTRKPSVVGKTPLYGAVMFSAVWPNPSLLAVSSLHPCVDPEAMLGDIVTFFTLEDECICIAASLLNNSSRVPGRACGARHPGFWSSSAPRHVRAEIERTVYPANCEKIHAKFDPTFVEAFKCFKCITRRYCRTKKSS